MTTIALLLTSILGIVVYFVPYYYLLLCWRDIKREKICSRLVKDFIKIIIFYIAFWLFFTPFPGDYLSTLTFMFSPQIKLTFILFGTILPAFYKSFSNNEQLTLRDDLISGTYMLVFEFMLLRILVITNIIYLNINARILNQNTSKYIISAKNSLMFNVRYVLIVSFLTILITLITSIFLIKKGKDRLFLANKHIFSIPNVIFNVILVVIAHFAIIKNQTGFIAAYIIVVILITNKWTKKKFKAWLNEYTKDILKNVIQVLLIGIVYTFSNSGESLSYIKNDLFTMILSVVMCYIFVYVEKYNKF